MVIIATLMALTAAFALYALWSFWPAPLPAASATAVPGPTTFTYFRWDTTLTRDQQYFVIVAVAGVIGAMLHGLRSLAKYVGERKFVRSWIASYLLLPFVGAIIATIVYLVLRAGLLPGANSASQPDPFGITAIAALVGWFSAQAAEKMKDVFQTLFKAPDAGSDSITNNVTMTSFAPEEGPAGSTVVITGTNLNSVKRVVFTADAEATILSQSDTTLSVEVPGDAQDGSITLDPGPSEAASTGIFTVSPPPPDGSDSDDGTGVISVVVTPHPVAPQLGTDGSVALTASEMTASAPTASTMSDSAGRVGTIEELADVGMVGSTGRVGTTDELAAVGAANIAGEP
ncbi:hypothetical protein ASD90_22650 [Terrabacter sp. Root181]|nr:hypothetical protein ASD90_22650 [Terrabacter sp. Root181]